MSFSLFDYNHFFCSDGVIETDIAVKLNIKIFIS